ncbi:FtsX-like permease family protein [Bradyrhizobium diazoefficiens]|uniref:FtsX-like permease family protein n=1 Tax=Bradyrhizobium diazoefficiens TaxID=1355477 RepID=UPI0035168586
MKALDIKLFRDVRRMWAQVLAIALVVGGGVATLVLAVGSHRSLEETRIAYYERYGFGDVFAQAKRAPRALADTIADIPGVAAVDTRIAKLALLDIPGFSEPASGQFVSLPDNAEPHLNRLYIRSGRLPEPGRTEEVVVNEPFARAHGFSEGARFSAILNGKKRELIIVGTALSPEFVYTVGPGDLMPDDRRFAIVWMSEKALAGVYDLDGAFSAVSVKLQPGAAEREVILQLDALLDPYGGQAAHGRKDQTSHAWLDHELDMLNNMSRTLPPIFLLVSAFLVNLTLSRLVALEREQIGLLKALGYTDGSIVLHYFKFVAMIVAAGIVLGSIVGTLLGLRVTGLFGDFFHFPFLVFAKAPDLYVIAGALSAAAAAIGALRALREVVRLAPAVAMQPPAPPVYRRLLPASIQLDEVVSQPTLMMIRNIARHPVRAAFTALGMALATAILVVSLFTRDTMEQLIDVTYFLADRQDATIGFVEKRVENVVEQVNRLPGVLAAEPFREVPVRIRHGNVERRITISGRPAGADLRRHHRRRPPAGRASGDRPRDLRHARPHPWGRGRRYRRARSARGRPTYRHDAGRGHRRGLFRHQGHDGYRRTSAGHARGPGRHQRQPQPRREPEGGLLRGREVHADGRRCGAAARLARELPQDRRATHHHDGEHLHRARRRDRVRRRLQQRPDLAVGAGAGIGEPARPRLHARRGSAHPPA